MTGDKGENRFSNDSADDGDNGWRGSEMTADDGEKEGEQVLK